MSSTLPSFRTLAGLNGPSKSSVLLTAVGFTEMKMKKQSSQIQLKEQNS